jgi:hypothetical protein
LTKTAPTSTITYPSTDLVASIALDTTNKLLWGGNQDEADGFQEPRTGDHGTQQRMEHGAAHICAPYLRGWMQYFRLAETPKVYRELDSWVLHRLRLCQWKQWKWPRTRLRHLRALKLNEDDARTLAASRKGYWRTTGGALHKAMPGRYWIDRGFVGLGECFALSV